MVVADGASHSQTHEGCSDGSDTIDYISGVAFLWQHCAAVDDHVQTIEAGGNQLVLGWGFVKVTRKLKANKIIVRQVLVESPDDPVAIGRKIAVMVVMNAVGVGETNQIKPVSGDVLTESW